MAVIPKLSFCNSKDCLRLQITDNTGAYDTINNPGGWGAPNDTLLTVISAVIKVVLPDGDPLTPIIIDLAPEIPNSTYGIKILKSQDFNLTTDTALPDGTWIIDYEIIINLGGGSTKLITYHTEITLVCNAGNCVNAMFSKVSKTGCDCDTSLIRNAIDGYGILAMMQYSAYCQRPNEVKDLGIWLDKLCKTKDSCFSCN